MARISRIFVSLTPIYIFSKLCGFADFHIDSSGRFVFSDKLFMCSCAYHALMVLLLFYVVAISPDQIFASDASAALIMFNASGLTILFIVNKICQKWCSKSRVAPLWKNLGVIEKKLKALNMELKYGNISTESALTFLPAQIILTCLMAAQYYVSATLSSSKNTALIFAIFVYITESERTVITGQFCSLLIVMRNMFEAIAKKINNINPNENIQTTFRFLASFHQELCKAIRKTNRLYHFHLLMSFAADFLCFVTYTQVMVYDFLGGKISSGGALSIVWTIVLSSRLILTVTTSDSCVASVSKKKFNNHSPKQKLLHL